MTVVTLARPRELAEWDLPAAWPVPSGEEIEAQAPNATLVVREGSDLRACCSIWWTHAPPLDGQRLGVIGHFGATTAAATKELLDAACRALAEHGCTLATGPMDGNTWRRYRFVVERGTEPPFLLEPDNPEEWPAWWSASGFTPLAQYFSGLNTDLSKRDPRAIDVATRLTDNGVVLRELRPAEFESEMHRIYSVAEISFRENFLYTPLPEAAFAAQYQKVRALVVPQLVLIAEHGDRPVGFSFSIPDAQERARGERIRTIIVKTIAIVPERHLVGGLGSVMTDRTHATAHAMGFSRAIHALMHESNASLAISARTGSVMRRYALYARPLA